MLSIDELLVKRVKIISPFPGMEYYYNMKVGDILTDPGAPKAVTNQNGDAIVDSPFVKSL